jgi:hypothetical protein
VLTDERDSSGPRWHGVDALDQRHPNHSPKRISRRPVQRVASSSQTSARISGESSTSASWTTADGGGTFGKATEIPLCGPDPRRRQPRGRQSLTVRSAYGYGRTESSSENDYACDAPARNQPGTSRLAGGSSRPMRYGGKGRPGRGSSHAKAPAVSAGLRASLRSDAMTARGTVLRSAARD